MPGRLGVVFQDGLFPWRFGKDGATMKSEYKHLFGPVPSRRLGRSLGIDLTPLKTCTLDCVFCQLGRTTHQTLERMEYASAEAVEAELARWLREGGTADHLTLAGSGEPTLHSRFGEVLTFTREHTRTPTALLSNGTLFWMPEVRAAARQADIVKVSLSAWDAASFARVNRPHPALAFERVLEGCRTFRSEFRGALWIEVFLIPGMNSSADDAERIAALAGTIQPDEIHLNTAVRPPAEPFATAMTREEMEALAGLFRPRARVIAEFSSDTSTDVAANEATILAMLRRRPCTARQIAEAFGMHPNEVSKYIGKLTRTGQIRGRGAGDAGHFVAVDCGGKEEWHG